MKVDGNPSVSLRANNTTPVAIQYRTGDVVVVQTVKVQSVANAMSEALLRFPNGEVLSTIVKDTYVGKSGDFISLKVQSIGENHIYAKIISNSDNQNVPKIDTVSLLKSLNVPNTINNNQIAMQMLKSGIVPTEQNFNLISKFKKAYKDTSLDQIVFMIKNKIPISQQTIEILEALTEHQNLIGEDLILLLKQIKDEDKRDDLRELLKKFFKNPLDKQFDQSELKTEKTISDLVIILSYLKNKKSLGNDTSEKVKSFLDNLEMQLAVSKHMGETLLLQIPINNNGNYDTAEIYVYNHKETQNQEKTKNSIYLRVPTQNLGIVELLINIDGSKNMQCHFNLQDNVDYIKDNILELYEMVSNIGLRLTKVTYDNLPQDINLQNFYKYMQLMSDDKKFDEKI